MYYKERIIGALTYGLLLLIFAYIIKNNKINLKKILFVYALVLSIFAYFYIPNPGYDLERINMLLVQYYRPMSVNTLIDVLGKSFTPTINILYFLISKTQHLGLVPFTVSMVFYTCIFSVFLDVCKRFEICGLKRTLFLIFIMSLGTYLEVIANIRCMTAFSMIVYCTYHEIFNKKSLLSHLLIYFLAGTMHLAALAMIIIRIAIYPLQQDKWKIIYAILPLFILAGIYIFLPDFINQIFFTESYYKEHVAYMYIPEFILMSIMTLYIIFIKLIHWKVLFSNKTLKGINLFALVLFLLMLLNLDDYSMFHRTGTLHFLINIPIMGKYLSLLKTKNGIIFMFIVSVIVLFIAASFGNLCGFKYFILN